MRGGTIDVRLRV
jgi:hypothetical protein